MSEIDFEARQRILELQKTIFDLQAFTLLAVCETKALQELSIILWQDQQVELDENRDIPTVLESMRAEYLDSLLAEFADHKMEYASRLRSKIDEILKGK